MLIDGDGPYGDGPYDDGPYEIELRTLLAQDTAVVRRGITPVELTSWAAGVFGVIVTHLQRIGVPVAGDPFVRYLERGAHLEVEAGLPVTDRITPKDEVRPSSLPDGSAVSTWHHGHPADLDDAFEAIDAWLERQAAEAVGAPWVIHHPDPEADPGAPSWMSEVVQPYRE